MTTTTTTTSSVGGTHELCTDRERFVIRNTIEIQDNNGGETSTPLTPCLGTSLNGSRVSGLAVPDPVRVRHFEVPEVGMRHRLE